DLEAQGSKNQRRPSQGQGRHTDRRGSPTLRRAISAESINTGPEARSRDAPAGHVPSPHARPEQSCPADRHGCCNGHSRWRHRGGAATMDLLVHGFGQGRHMYNPFPKIKPPPPRKTPRTLQDLCHRAIIRQVTLRGLKGRALPSLPPFIRRQLTSLETEDFVEVECAPFRDIFDFNMYHRALTYRVTCPLDGCEYMAAHVGTSDSSSSSIGFWRWVQLAHPNLMCLTWKSWVDSFSFRNRVQSIFLGDKISVGGHYEIQANSPSSTSVVCLGFVLTKLASIALVDRRPSDKFY
ncbi:hypothetical protein HPB47_018170, partial [Ixodes persulcatus]